MKIVHVTAVYPPSRGGMATAPFELVQEQRARGHEVLVFAPTIAGRGDMPGVISLRPWLRAGHAALTPQLFWKLPACDILHLHYPCFGMSPYVWKWKIFTKRGRAAKLVLHYHMDPMLCGWQKIFWWLERTVVLPFLLRVADRVVVGSLDYVKNSALAPYIEKLGDRLVEIPFMVDTEKFTPAVHKENDPPLIMFLSALDKAHYFKGLDLLLQAMAKISKANLLVVGGGELMPLFARIREQLGLKDRVRFTGAVPEDKKIEYYKSADVFVLPSINKAEAFGIVLLEAQACGVPVVASDLPGVRMSFQDGRTGLKVKPGDAEDLRAKLEYLLSDKQKLATMGHQARVFVEEKFSVAKVMGRWEEVYRFPFHSSKNS